MVKVQVQYGLGTSPGLVCYGNVNGVVWISGNGTLGRGVQLS